MKRSRKLTLSIIFLIVFMTAGYLLLLLAYSGPRWIAFAVFVVYLVVSYAVVRLSWRYVSDMKKENIDNPHISS